MANLIKGHSPFRLLIPAGLAAVAVAVLLFGSFGNTPVARANILGPALYLDASAPLCTTSSTDPANSTAVLVGSPFQVGICIEDQLAAPQAVEATIDYNTAIVGGTELPNTAPDINDNPDLNDGAGPTRVGVAWDCTNFNTTFAAINNGSNQTHISCADTTLGSDSQLTADPGLYATASYTATGVGTSIFSFTTDGTSGDGGGPSGIGNCADSGSPAPLNSTNCIGAAVQILPAADIQIDKQAPLTAVAGTAIHYILTVTNNGPSPATNVNVFDDLEDTWVVSSVKVDGNEELGGLCVVGPQFSFVNVASCGLGAMNALDTHVIDITVTIDESYAGKLVLNSALAGSGTAPGIIDETPDPNFTPIEAIACQLDLLAGDAPVNVGGVPCPGGTVGNNTANDVSPLELCASDRYDGTPFDNPPGTFVDVLPGADCNNVALAATQVLPALVSVQKAPTTVTVNVGSTATWNVTVAAGAGGSPASAVSISDTVDANQSIVSASGAGWACVVSGTPGVTPANSVNCTLTGSIAPGSNSVVQVVANVLTSPANNICSNSVTATYADPITTAPVNATVICLPPNVAMYKDKHPESATRENVVNLWLCDPGYDGSLTGPNNAPTVGSAPCDENGEGRLLLGEMIANVNDPEGLGAYEFQLKYDHKIFDVNITDAGFLGSTGRTVNCTNSIFNENAILFGCVSTGAMNGPQGNGMLATIEVLPKADLRFRMTPGQENGIARIILDENCEAADIFGDPLANATGDPLPGVVNGGLVEDCDDVQITVRILEGDLDLDCDVDVADDQAIAFRYGAYIGSLRYDPWYDLEPALRDYDIDIKDLQKVFGRNGSECSQSGLPADGTIPAQPPTGANVNIGI
jgi:uncharacterized repeat protein (TIGR01451 family)